MAQAKREWVGGRFALQATVQELGDQAPTVTLWLELPEGVVVGQGVDGPGATAATFAESLAAATREPLTGPARRPELVRVASEELAEGVRALGFEVSVAPTPELDDLVASLTAMMRRGTYFDDPSTTTVALERFFQAARGLWERAPWSDVDDTCIFELDVPAHGLQGAVLSIVGAYDQAYGFALFPSFAAFDEASDAAPPGSTSALYLSFDPRSELPRQMVDEVAQHGWPLASEQAYPFLMRLEGGAPVPVAARDYELATAVMSTLGTFLDKHAAAFADFGDLYVEESLEEAGLAVTLRMPHPHWEEEGPAARALTLSSDNPYELPLTDAELRSLEKKLAPRTLHRVMGTLCAVASVPAPIPPSVWLNKLLEDITFKGEAEFTAQSRLLFAGYDHVLDVIDQDCIDMLVPEPEDEAACRDWAQGYLAMMPHAGPTALREELVDVLFDLQTVAEEPRVLQVLDRVRGDKSRDTFRTEARERLADDAARLLEVWAEAREQAPEAEAAPEPVKREAPKVGRNDPCPCGSGKKAKKCCGAAS